MKYVIDEYDHVIIFNDQINHDQIVVALPGRPISAGYVTIFNNNVKCRGESLKLKISSRGEEDVKIITRHIDL